MIIFCVFLLRWHGWDEHTRWCVEVWNVVYCSKGLWYHLTKFTTSPFVVATWSHACAAAHCPLMWPTGKIYSSGAIWKEKKKRWYFQLWPICRLLFQSTVPQVVVLTELSQVFVTDNWDESGVMRIGELGLGKITDSAFSLQLFPVPVFLLHSCDLSVF